VVTHAWRFDTAAMTTANLPIPPSSPAPAQPYVDRKRFAWVLSLLVPLSIATGPLLWFWYPHTLMLWLPVFFVYGVAPALDWILGTDTSNPPESAVPGLEADPYYRRVTFALVPLLWAAFIGAAWFSQVAGITWVGLLGLIISTGGVGGFCINLGHEIGHKRAPLERDATFGRRFVFHQCQEQDPCQDGKDPQVESVETRAAHLAHWPPRPKKHS